MVVGLYDGLINGYGFDYQTIKYPSPIDIDNQKSGTFIVSCKEKYSSFPFTLGMQTWVTPVGNNAYMITFMSTEGGFESPENNQIRDHFIQSIKFLHVNN